MNTTNGLIFPLKLDNGKAKLADGGELLKSSMLIILSWFFNREFTQDFRSRLDEVVEEPNDDISTDLVRHFIVDSITYWEKRIKLLEVEISRPTPSSLSVYIKFYSKELNVEDDFTFNYQLN